MKSIKPFKYADNANQNKCKQFSHKRYAKLITLVQMIK